jgi:drug/metabolite transporter (DMT)-like permease
VRFERLAALGALGVCAGVIGLYLLVVFVARVTPTGGTDTEHAVLTAISLAPAALAIVAVHLVYARILMREAKQGS